MQEPFFIKKVAVLGAGVMGAQIAAHCVNAGIETLLFDLAAKEGAANSIVDKSIAHLAQLKPAPLASQNRASCLLARNYDEHLGELSTCDLVIEAIAERMDWKEALLARISPYLTAKTILVTNTSGLGINLLANGLPEAIKANFCGVHFFNPPRYMHLAELIPSNSTSPQLLDHLETWLTSYLGKGVVRAKDTPNFIANRVGVFSMLAILHHTSSMNMAIDEVDALTGVLLGRPKSATYRTMDVVGLDTMAHVVNTMKEQLKEDPWHEVYQLPDWLNSLIKQGHLGQKTGQGIYRKNGKIIEVFDVNKGRYVPSQAEVSEEIKRIMKISDPVARMNHLLTSTDKQAQFLAACFRDLFHYCAYHLESIASSVRDVDLAIRWGFGWTQGPFETWQASGIERVIQFINQSIHSNAALSSAALPAWVSDISAFYTDHGAYSPVCHAYEARSQLPVYEKQFFPDRVLHEKTYPASILYENSGVCLKHLQDDIAILSFKSKSNTIGQDVLDGIEAALDKAESQCQGVILYQHDASNFSSGADLRGVAALIQDARFEDLDQMIAQFQRVAMRLKYSFIPIIAALRGRALGGGCELILHCSAVVAAFETYPGLVELGVGVIPAGGGCKEMALRASKKTVQHDLLPALQPYYQQIATARVAGSAVDALQMGYLRHTDTVVMHVNEVLYAAFHKIKSMQAANYLPPLKEQFKVAGIEGHARLQAGLVNWLEGGFISSHDYLLANELAYVLCGGNVNQGSMVDEKWMLNLEREAFIKLAQTPLSQARIHSILETGKPMRN